MKNFLALLLIGLSINGFAQNSISLNLSRNDSVQYVVDATGKTKPQVIGSTIALTDTKLQPNGTWSTGWLERKQFIGAQTTVYSDVAGSYSVEYSEDAGATLVMPSVSVPYALTGQTRKGAFDISASWVRFVYTNGNQLQTKFKFEIRFLVTNAQASLETLNATGADTRFAQWTKSRIETKNSDSGTYAPVYRTGNSLNVHVDNQTGADSTKQRYLQGAVVQNFPSNQTVTVFNPYAVLSGDSSKYRKVVSVDNLPAAYSVSASDSSKYRKVISIDNLPATQQVNGSVSVSNLPSTQVVSGTVAVSNPYSVTAADSTKYRKNISVDNFPANQVVSGAVSVTNPYTVASADSIKYRKVVSIDNLPSTQAVTGTVTANIDSLKTRLNHQVVILGTPNVTFTNSSLPVTGTFWQSIQPVSGNVGVTNFPANQVVSGTVTANIDSTKTRVQQQVTVLNFPDSTKSRVQLNLPAGASTAANQATEITALQALQTSSTPPANSTVTSVTTLATVVTVLAANPLRKNVKFFSLTGTILIKEGTAASATSFTNRITTNGIWEPQAPIYTGIYTAIGAGTLLVTENF